jgi:leukotriene-A4 hydrolase
MAAAVTNADTAFTDHSSQSNYPTAKVTHTAFDVDVDFDSRTIAGRVVLSVLASNDVDELVLDTRDLAIEKCVVDGADATFALQADAHPVMGSALTIAFPTPLAAGATASVEVSYKTSPSSSAVQWLRPEQTAGGSHPYLFTQCQAIHARSLYPCQDSPAAKMTYEAKVSAPSALTALMSAIPTGSTPAPGGAKTTYAFEQKVSIPPYLLALAVGDLESREIGPRSRVWSEPSMVEAGAFEFNETEDFLAAAEEVAGPYVWGRYDLLLLPPSFPYGGMENPCLTFVTPTLLAGDRSQAHVVAHEIAHSWSGNLVTNSTWEHFWLNEGFTVFVERKIMHKLYGKAIFDFNAIGGLMELKETVARLGPEHPHTVLQPTLEGGVDPDDVFSKVPYEKGFAFLVYLEHMTRLDGHGEKDALDAANGTDAFATFLRSHFEKNKFATTTSEKFRASYAAAFPVASAQVDWDAWLRAPGMPPVDVGAYYDGSSSAASGDLARRWHLCDVLGMGSPSRPADVSAADVEGWSSTQIDHFLLSLLEYRGGTHPLSLPVIASLEELYGLSAYKNSEIKCKWLQLRLGAGDVDAFAPTAEMLRSMGRMKYLRPLYRSLKLCKEGGKAFAEETFQKTRGMYHPIAEKMVAADLGVA